MSRMNKKILDIYQLHHWRILVTCIISDNMHVRWLGSLWASQVVQEKWKEKNYYDNPCCEPGKQQPQQATEYETNQQQ